MTEIERTVTRWWAVPKRSDDPHRSWLQVADWLYGAHTITWTDDRELLFFLYAIAVQRARIAADELYPVSKEAA